MEILWGRGSGRDIDILVKGSVDGPNWQILSDQRENSFPGGGTGWNLQAKG